MPFKRGHLKYFVAVAEEGQMTRAAAKLYMAQPALSQAISQLEAQLGVQLFERHARGVSLTPAGHAFLGKARLALDAEADASLTAQSLARAGERAIEFGYLGLPPGLTSPNLIETFADKHPDIELRFHELPFPSGSTASWLGEVDVVLSRPPQAEPEIWTQTACTQPRVVVAPKSHPLAKRSELIVAEVLDETFLGTHPSVQTEWAGFWNLDDHRGGPAPNQSRDSALNSQEKFAMIADGQAITTLPAGHASIVAKILTNVVAIPLRDADPVLVTLLGRENHANPLVEDLRAVARNLAEKDADGPSPPASLSGTYVATP